MKKIKSEIFTKISRVNLAFKDQITALRGDGCMESLHRFVVHMHPKNTDIVSDGKSINAYTPKGHYLYRIYPSHIVRVNCQNQRKTIYEIQ